MAITATNTCSITMAMTSSAPHSSEEPLDKDLLRRQDIKRANSYLETGYDLVWNKEDYEEAINVLHKALEIQQRYLKKYDREVGWTYNFLGTALWLDGQLSDALLHFCEARRVFSKCHAGSKTIRPLEERISHVLEDLGFSELAVSQYIFTLQQAMETELVGDRYKAQGKMNEARQEFNKVRLMSKTLKQLMACCKS